MTQAVRTEERDGVLWITLDRPNVLNALNDDVLAGLNAAADQADASSCSVAVLSGAGRAFCAGADLSAIDAVNGTGAWADRRRQAGRWNRTFDRMAALPQVLVACLHGAVVGGGTILALTADLRVAADDMRFWIPEVAMGRPLTWTGNPRLVREIGLSRARELVMTGRKVGAEEALHWGLVHRAGDLDEERDVLLTELLAMPAAPLATTKEHFRAIGQVTTSDALAWADPELLDAVSENPESMQQANDYVQRVKKKG